MCGGGGSGASKDQLKRQNDLQEQAFNLMKEAQGKVSNAVSQYLTGNVGFDPQQLALLKSQFLNSTANQYKNAGANVRTALLRSGSADSSGPVGGDYVRGIAGLEGGLANTTSSGMAGIDLQNLSQALNNKFNAASLINGQAAQLTSPIATFGSGASNALSNYVQSQQNTFGNAFFRGFGGGFGQGLGGGLASGALGGFGSFLSSMKPSGYTAGDPSICWIAEELYGVDAPETEAVRARVKSRNQDFMGAKFLESYKAVGPILAEMIKTDSELRSTMKSMFDKWLAMLDKESVN